MTKKVVKWESDKFEEKSKRENKFFILKKLYWIIAELLH